jgi:hypothetical protein
MIHPPPRPGGNALSAAGSSIQCDAAGLGARLAGLAASEMAEEGTPPAPGGRLCCAACGLWITDARERIPVAGAMTHERENPLGVRFTFHCYASAAGADAMGTPTLEHTWFPAQPWRMTRCRRCGCHLGWHFGGATPFYGLLVQALVPCPAAPAPPSPV